MRFSSLYFVPWFRDASLSWQRVWGKWNANRATKFPAATAEQSILRIFLRLDFSSWTSMNHESAQHTKQSAILRGLRGESGSTLTLLRVSQECEGKKKRKLRKVIIVAACAFFDSPWAWHWFHRLRRLLSQRDRSTWGRSFIFLGSK